MAMVRDSPRKTSTPRKRPGRYSTVVPLSIYFNARGIAKCQLGIAKGKRQADKRETIKKRDWQREQSRLLRSRNR